MDAKITNNYSMEKRKLAQKRNYFKFVLVGMPKPVDMKALTDEEASLFGQIMEIRLKLINSFDKNSIKMGLRVPPKCWCGREGKYPSPSDRHTGLVCKIHLDESYYKSK